MKANTVIHTIEQEIVLVNGKFTPINDLFETETKRGKPFLIKDKFCSMIISRSAQLDLILVNGNPVPDFLKKPIAGYKAAGTGIPVLKKLREKEPFYATVYKHNILYQSSFEKKKVTASMVILKLCV